MGRGVAVIATHEEVQDVADHVTIAQYLRVVRLKFEGRGQIDVEVEGGEKEGRASQV